MASVRLRIESELLTMDYYFQYGVPYDFGPDLLSDIFHILSTYSLWFKQPGPLTLPQYF